MKTIILSNKNSKLTFSLVFKESLSDPLEKVALSNVVRVIEQNFKFQIEKDMLLFGWPPYCKFYDKDGVSVYVALDDFDGLSIDSNSEEFLQKLQPFLEKDDFLTTYF